jgi:DNA-binding response OmpR family regulator
VLSALAKARIVTPRLFLLDIMMPGEDGLDFCKRLRTMPQFASTPIIFVTAKVSEDDRVLGLECGADDYITKPFSPRELVARVKAALRKREPQPEVLKFGDLEVDTGAMTIRLAGQLVPMTTVEYRIVEALARSPRRVLTREQLLQASVGSDSCANPRAMDVYISRIRDKIEPIPRSPIYILTVRGAGYRFTDAAAALPTHSAGAPGD